MLPAKSARPIAVGAILALAALVAVAILALHFAINTNSPIRALGSPTFSLTKKYSNPDLGFSVKMPADLTVCPANPTPNRDTDGSFASEVIQLQNAKGEIVVQIAMFQDDRASSDNTFTLDDLAHEFPAIDPARTQPVPLPHGVMPDIHG